MDWNCPLGNRREIVLRKLVQEELRTVLWEFVRYRDVYNVAEHVEVSEMKK